jgi:hypothetical protein
MAEPQKDTIYIDVEDEITSIIDKVHTSKQRIVALVLPKRATMLQSSVNMKLLKKAADGDSKQVVLITSEAGLLPLAGATGLYVAKNLQSKPEVPEAVEASAPMDELLTVDESEQPDELDTKTAGKKPVGELAGLAASEDAEKTSKAKPELTPRHIPRAVAVDEAIELDNSEDAQEAEAVESKAKKPKGKKTKVPNFEKFRLRLILAAVLLIILIVGWILASIILPHATITAETNTSNVNASLTINLSTSAKTLDQASLTVPAQLQQTQNSQHQTVNTTGQQNNGQKASGTVTLSAPCSSFTGPTITVSSGTALSSSALTFITQSSVTMNYFTSNCQSKPNGSASGSTSVTAQQGGTQYNLSSASFTDSQNTNVTGTGSTSSGTDSIVQIVSQTDITNAEQQLASPNTSTIKTGLQQALQQAGYYAIPASFNVGTPSTSTSANVGNQASSVTVTQTTTYTMFGVHQADLQTLINNNVNGQIDTSKQSILSDGVSSASLSVLNQSSTGAQLTMQSTAVVGPKLDIASLKAQVAGKKSGDAQTIIGSNPGVTNVKIHLSPFWVGAVPKKTSKITINVTKSS